MHKRQPSPLDREKDGKQGADVSISAGTPDWMLMTPVLA